MIFTHPEFDNHEMVMAVNDAATGLKAIIAIHNTTLGAGFGGCRAYPYASFDEALTDVLRLSKGMTYKNAAAGVPYGGGKSVVLAEPGEPVTAAQRLAFAAFVERLGGTYITAEDVGTSTADVAVMGKATQYIRNLPLDDSGKPSPFTARGVLCGMEAGWAFVADKGLDSATVAVEGVGAVGMELCRLLSDAGAKLIVVDRDFALSREVREQFGAEIAELGRIHAAEADIYAPCALGGTLNEKTIPEITAKVVAGGANNQLKIPQDGYRLQERGIIYCPDYVINAGGVLSVAEQGKAFDPEEAYRRASTIGPRITDVLISSRDWKVPPHVAADRLAKQILIEAANRQAEAAPTNVRWAG